MTAKEALEHLENADASGINHDDIYGPGDEVQCWRTLADRYRRYPQIYLLPDLIMLLRRNVRALKLIDSEHPVAAKTWDFMKRHDLLGSIIRTQGTPDDDE